MGRMTRINWIRFDVAFELGKFCRHLPIDEKKLRSIDAGHFDPACKLSVRLRRLLDVDKYSRNRLSKLPVESRKKLRMRDEAVKDGPITVPSTNDAQKPKARRPVVVIFFIACWFLANGTTVLLNKYIFKILGFRFPLSLTLMHMVVQSFLAHLTVDYLKSIEKIHVEREDYYSKLLVIAVVFCMNICLGNVSLRYVPVSFMQTVKSLTPVCTALLQFLVFRSRLTTPALLALIPVTGGVALASATELQFHLGGFIAALIACFLTGLKFVLSSQMLSGRYKLDSINLLYYMAPPSAAILIPAVLYFELSDVMTWANSPSRTNGEFLILMISGLVSFVLNVTLFVVLKATSSVTVTVAGNVKTVLVIFSSLVIFRNPVTTVNMVGCLVAVGGCCWYGLVKEKWATMGTMDTSRMSSPSIPLADKGDPKA